MSDVSCMTLPDLGEGAENWAAESTARPAAGLRLLWRRFKPLEQSPLVMKSFVLGNRMSPL